MFGQSAALFWFAELLLFWLAAGVEDEELELLEPLDAAFAIAAPPPAMTPVAATVTSALRIQVCTSFTSFLDALSSSSQEARVEKTP